MTTYATTVDPVRPTACARTGQTVPIVERDVAREKVVTSTILHVAQGTTPPLQAYAPNVSRDGIKLLRARQVSSH
eukprot:COSAG06_NODE_57263_length_281_cov_0.571429_1_plen_74_part_01